MDRILKNAYRLVISWLSQRKDVYCFPKALKKLSMFLLKLNAFSCAYMFFIKFACSPKCFSMSFVHYYNSSVCENQPRYVLLWWHVPMQCLFVIATIMRNSLNFKITSLILEMIYTANGKFIHFSSRNIFVVKTPGEAEFVERDDWALSSVRGVRQGVLFSPTFFIARSYCKGARVWMERETGNGKLSNSLSFIFCV